MNYPIYLDCCATTPIDNSVKETLLHYLTEDYGNEGSRTHEYGSRAKQAVYKARDQVAAVVGAKRDEVIFTSGATESNNLAILGLADTGRERNKQHIITSNIEHKAVLEPIECLGKQGFDISYLSVDRSGRIDPNAVQELLRPETLLVSVMQANNETGVLQPITEIAEVLQDHEAYFHCDAAQGFGKELASITNTRVDLISLSGHKIYAPKGIGALVARRRGYRKAPLHPLLVGGGQERGLRPGTLSVPLIAALGQAAACSWEECEARKEVCKKIRHEMLQVLETLDIQLTGDQHFTMPHVLNFSIDGIDSEALMVTLKDIIAISNGSACTSTSYTSSHVLRSMGFSEDEANSCVRLSWCHLTPRIDWELVKNRIQSIR